MDDAKGSKEGVTGFDGMMRRAAQHPKALWPGAAVLLLAVTFLLNAAYNRSRDADPMTNGTYAFLVALLVLGLLYRRYAPKRPATRPRRAHPYADEVSPEAESKVDGKRLALLWVGGSTLLAVVGYWLNVRYSVHGGLTPLDAWNDIAVAVLTGGLVLLALRTWVPRPWARHLGIPGWILFGFYWGLTARDLFVSEDSDYVNSIAAALSVYLFTYFAYHEWLSTLRKVGNEAVTFMRKTAIIASGTYFAIAYITPFRIGLINIVGKHTNWALNLFGFGSDLGLQFTIDKFDILGPVEFQYPDTYGLCPDGTSPIYSGTAPCLDHSGAANWFQDLLFYIPQQETLIGSHGLKIVGVSIILACTAIQTIMLFVGMFLATPHTPLKTRLKWSLGIGSLIYFLNLLRNTLVIWAYGRGHTSFWVIHNFLAKLITLTALVGIVLVLFKWFPGFLRILGQVIDLPHRDGPLEKALRIGRRRPKGPDALPTDAPAPDVPTA